MKDDDKPNGSLKFIIGDTGPETDRSARSSVRSQKSEFDITFNAKRRPGPGETGGVVDV